ncbi:MAG: TrpB-like pyridoxal phosphate-dependent enzyme [candidate division Zixibacteria bacterium]|nr:TrpB-like pyridoxal phosphate-dependent enzyme [candidate division Zixibacteria bacterium]
MSDTRILLSEREMPRAWYNIQADLPRPLYPPLHPATRKPVGPEDLAPLFPMELIKQEVSRERYIEIPEEVLDIYKMWRPTPLHRAKNLEKALDTPAKIYYKNESVSPPGSHKANTSVAQAYYNKKEGVKRLVTETGAGQWGSALAFGCSLFGIECRVYMVRVSYNQKPYRKILIENWGGEIFASPSSLTDSGRKILAKYPDSSGSLGIAISEAVEEAAKNDNAKYSLGSVLNHVMLHQTIIGQEARKQFEMAGDYPDVVIGCVGGGSNFSGFAFPFVRENLTNGHNSRIVAVEPTACPTLTKGLYSYDYGDTVGLTPLLKMYTLGHDFVPAPIHAGGLRYHGDAPLLCLLYDEKAIEAVAVHQRSIFEAADLFTKTEGILPAPESAHAIRTAIDEALKCKESGEKKTIAFCLSGHGHFDLSAYDSYRNGVLDDYEYPEEELKRLPAQLPKV